MASESAGSRRRKFVEACFRNRRSSQRFLDALQIYETKYPSLSSSSLAKELLDAGYRHGVVDPRLPTYLEALLDSKRLDVSTLLSAIQPPPPEDGTAFLPSLPDAGDSSKPSLQTVVLQLLTRKIANGYIGEDSELFLFLKKIIPWMTYFPSSILLGLLVSATLGCPAAQENLPNAKAKSTKKCFASQSIVTDISL